MNMTINNEHGLLTALTFMTTNKYKIILP